MQIIQSIREKGAAIIIVVIALSLIGFILMDARQGTGGGFFGSSDKIAKINGRSYSLTEFNNRVSDAEAAEAARTGQTPDANGKNRIREQVWNQIIAETVFYAQTEKLGISTGAAETKAILISDDPSNPLLQERGFADPATGKIDKAKAAEAYNNIRKAKGEQRRQIDAQILEPLRLSSAVAKYGGMLSASSYYPTWMKERDAKEASEFATISYVSVPYAEIPDSSVKVTDDDIRAYVSRHKSLFKQEAGRTISYVTFSQLPSSADSAASRKQVEGLRSAFAADTNAKAFLARQTSAIDFRDEFIPKASINTPNIDSIIAVPQGSVYGPYVDQNNFVLAKVIGSKTFPDSVNVRHILIGTRNAQTGAELRTDSAAKKLADSLLVAINNKADFAALVTAYSDDPGSKEKGGVYEKVPYGQMVPPFNDFIFNKPVGSRDVVKTDFGYHVIEVLKQGPAKPAYKIAYLAKEINAGEQTINESSLAATRASTQKDAKALEAYIKPLGKSMITPPAPLKENDFSVSDMQDARGLVKWAFEAKKGQVSEPFQIGDNYVVAVLNDINKKDEQSITQMRLGAEAEVIKEKKADIIVKKLGANPTLESAASATGKQIQVAGADSTLTMAVQLISGVGIEYKVIGAAFNKAYQGKPSPPIRGTSAVFVIKTNAISAKAPAPPEVATERENKNLTTIRNQTANWFEPLRKNADIDDRRSKFY